MHKKTPPAEMNLPLEGQIFMQGFQANAFMDCLAEKVAEKLFARMQNNSGEDEQLLSIKETCSLFNPKVTPATIHNWSRDGKLQKHHIGGRVFWKKSEVLASLVTLQKYRR